VRASPLPFSISLATEVVILHCPWWGRDLNRRYRKQVEALSAIRPVTTLEEFKAGISTS